MSAERIKELEEMVHLYYEELKKVKASSSEKLARIKTELLAWIEDNKVLLVGYKGLMTTVEALFE